MIKIQNVSFQYKDSNKVLENLNFEVKDGEILAIVGKNGSGKSTLGKLIAGIIKLKKGNIIVDDLEVNKKANQETIRNKVGIVFQTPENQIIFNHVEDEIAFSLKGIEKEEIKHRIQESLKKVGMLKLKDADLYNLSLGQKQRVMIAEILARHPKYIILDEPTTMIDSLAKEKIYQIIKDLKKQGYTILCITNLADEMLLADRILILENGKIVAEIKREELVEKIEVLKKYEIKLPTILEVLDQLKQNEIELRLEEYTAKGLANALKGKIVQ